MGQPPLLSEEEEYILTLPFDFGYYCKLRETFENGDCGFCTIDPSVNKVVFENEHWLIFENSFQYNRPCEVMLVIIARDHWRTLEDIVPEAWKTFGQMVVWACKNYNIPGGVLFLRFGPMSSNTGTMPHMHWNIWVPDPSVKGEGRRVWIPIQKTEAEEIADVTRTAEFAKRYEAGERVYI